MGTQHFDSMPIRFPIPFLALPSLQTGALLNKGEDSKTQQHGHGLRVTDCLVAQGELIFCEAEFKYDLLGLLSS